MIISAETFFYLVISAINHVMNGSEASPAIGGAGGSSPEFSLPCASVLQMGCGFALRTRYDTRNLPRGSFLSAMNGRWRPMVRLKLQFFFNGCSKRSSSSAWCRSSSGDATMARRWKGQNLVFGVQNSHNPRPWRFYL
jgi:hypothetical protein